MPEIHVPCPSCKVTWHIADARIAGRRVKCPRCGVKSRVPGLDAWEGAEEEEPVLTAAEAAPYDEPAARPARKRHAPMDDEDEPAQPAQGRSRRRPRFTVAGMCVGVVACAYLAALGLVYFGVFDAKPSTRPQTAGRQAQGGNTSTSRETGGAGGVAQRLPVQRPVVQQPQQPAFAVSADEFYRAYNERKDGQQKYENKVGEVTGIVQQYARLYGGGEANIQLAGSHKARHFDVRTPDGTPWNKLCPGQKATFRGRANGGYLFDAVLVNAGPSPATIISAERLSREHRHRRELAKKMYKNKWLLIDGRLAERKKDARDVTYVRFITSGGPMVVCTFLPFLKDEVPPLNTGQHVQALALYGGFEFKDGQAVPEFQTCHILTELRALPKQQATEDGLPSSDWSVTAGKIREPAYQGKPLSEWIDFLLHDRSVILTGEYQDAWNAVAPKAGPGVPQLARALEEKSQDTRERAARILARLGPAARGAVPALAKALKGDKSITRMDYCRALAAIGPEARAAVPALLECLGEFEPIAELAARALGKIGADSETVVPALITGLKSNRRAVRSGAAHALGDFGPRAKAAVEPLLQATTGYDADLRVEAALALWRISRHEAALPVLQEVLKGQAQAARMKAAGALWQVDHANEQTFPVLLAGLKDRNDGVRYTAAVELGEIGTSARQAKAALVEASKDQPEYVQRAITEALRKIDPDAAAN